MAQSKDYETPSFVNYGAHVGCNDGTITNNFYIEGDTVKVKAIDERTQSIETSLLGVRQEVALIQSSLAAQPKISDIEKAIETHFGKWTSRGLRLTPIRRRSSRKFQNDTYRSLHDHQIDQPMTWKATWLNTTLGEINVWQTLAHRRALHTENRRSTRLISSFPDGVTSQWTVSFSPKPWLGSFSFDFTMQYLVSMSMPKFAIGIDGIVVRASLDGYGMDFEPDISYRATDQIVWRFCESGPRTPTALLMAAFTNYVGRPGLCASDASLQLARESIMRCERFEMSANEMTILEEAISGPTLRSVAFCKMLVDSAGEFLSVLDLRSIEIGQCLKHSVSSQSWDASSLRPGLAMLDTLSSLVDLFMFDELSQVDRWLLLSYARTNQSLWSRLRGEAALFRNRTRALSLFNIDIQVQEIFQANPAQRSDFFEAVAIGGSTAMMQQFLGTDAMGDMLSKCLAWAALTHNYSVACLLIANDAAVSEDFVCKFSSHLGEHYYNYVDHIHSRIDEFADFIEMSFARFDLRDTENKIVLEQLCKLVQNLIDLPRCYCKCQEQKHYHLGETVRIVRALLKSGILRYGRMPHRCLYGWLQKGESLKVTTPVLALIRHQRRFGSDHLRLQLLQLFIDHGYDLEETDAGQTAVEHAWRYGQAEPFKILVKAGAITWKVGQEDKCALWERVYLRLLQPEGYQAPWDVRRSSLYGVWQLMCQVALRKGNIDLQAVVDRTIQQASDRVSRIHRSRLDQYTIHSHTGSHQPVEGWLPCVRLVAAEVDQDVHQFPSFFSRVWPILGEYGWLWRVPILTTECPCTICLMRKMPGNHAPLPTGWKVCAWPKWSCSVSRLKLFLDLGESLVLDTNFGLDSQYCRIVFWIDGYPRTMMVTYQAIFSRQVPADEMSFHYYSTGFDEFPLPSDMGLENLHKQTSYPPVSQVMATTCSLVPYFVNLQDQQRQWNCPCTRCEVFHGVSNVSGQIPIIQPVLRLDYFDYVLTGKGSPLYRKYENSPCHLFIGSKALEKTRKPAKTPITLCTPSEANTNISRCSEARHYVIRLESFAKQFIKQQTRRLRNSLISLSHNERNNEIDRKAAVATVAALPLALLLLRFVDGVQTLLWLVHLGPLPSHVKVIPKALKLLWARIVGIVVHGADVVLRAYEWSPRRFLQLMGLFSAIAFACLMQGLLA